MACAHAKFTGEVGVCLATSGPGAIHLLNGLYDAKLDHQPVVAIVGQQARPALGGDYQQEVDLADALQGRRARVRADGDRRRRRSATWSTARCGSRSPSARVTCIIVPNDLAGGGRRRDAAARARHGPLGRRLLARRASCPRDDDLRARRRGPERGREGRDAGRRRARSHAADEVARRSPSCSAPASPRRCSARRSLPDDLPFVTGSIGLLGTQAELGADDRTATRC